MNMRALLAIPLVCAALVSAVTAAADPPAAKRTFAGAGPNQRVDSGAQVVMFGNGRSLDGRPIRFSWRQVAGPSVELRNANHSTARFRAPRVDALTVLRFEITVTDTAGGTGTSVVKITVEPPKAPTSAAQTETTTTPDTNRGAQTPAANSQSPRYRIRD